MKGKQAEEIMELAEAMWELIRVRPIPTGMSALSALTGALLATMGDTDGARDLFLTQLDGWLEIIEDDPSCSPLSQFKSVRHTLMT